MFALVDCNNFYASCERVFRPDLNGKPIAVLSNNDGCVISRSNEAKAAGVPMGIPAFQYENLFREKGVHVFSANFELYGDLSNRVMDILETYCPDIEIYSIDEAFLCFHVGSYTNLEQLAKKMREEVVRCTGIPISVGLAPTKALTKVAVEIVKKFPERTGGVYVMDTEEKRIKALKWMPIEKMWGVGRSNAKRLKEVNVHSSYDFTLLQDSWVLRNMSIVGVRLKRDLLGVPTLDLDETKQKKNIATTRTFEKAVIKREDIVERVATFTAICAEKLRKQHSCCNFIQVFLQEKTGNHSYRSASRSSFVKLPYPTNSTLELVSFAVKTAEKLFVEGVAYRRAGVILMDFEPENEIQLNFFENSDPKHASLMKAIDEVNALFGQQKVRLAVQDQGRVWKMKQDRLSPRYTTRFDELMVVSAR